VTEVHFVVPEGIDDPDRPSGGNVYDRRVSCELAALGWLVHEHAVPGSWPTPVPEDLAALWDVVSAIPDGSVVMLDGLIASAAPEVLVPEARRLSLVILVHMPLGDGSPGEAAARREATVMTAAAAVVTPGESTRRWLVEEYSLHPDRVHVVEPGVDAADIAPGTAAGGELLCVAAVTPNKGHEVLLAALAKIRHLGWQCTCVGSLSRDAGFVDRLQSQARADGIGGRVRFTGPLTGPALDAAYAGGDLFVLASRAESYGMVVTEALARGLPVVATCVGGLPQAIDGESGGARPGLLVPPDAPAALADALSAWLGDVELRRRLRRAAEQRRDTLFGWSVTAERMSRVLAGLA